MKWMKSIVQWILYEYLWKWISDPVLNESKRQFDKLEQGCLYAVCNFDFIFLIGDTTDFQILYCVYGYGQMTEFRYMVIVFSQG